MENVKIVNNLQTHQRHRVSRRLTGTDTASRVKNTLSRKLVGVDRISRPEIRLCRSDSWEITTKYNGISNAMYEIE